MTPTQRKAMEQALKALELWNSYAYSDIITTLRTALAEQPAEPVYLEVSCPEHPKWLRVNAQQFEDYKAHGWNCRKLYTTPQPAPQPALQPLLVRDLAELIGSTVPDVCKALEDLGIKPRRSTNAAVTPDEALAVARRLAQPAKREEKSETSNNPAPLTEEERRYMIDFQVEGGDLFDIARTHAITGEAK